MRQINKYSQYNKLIQSLKYKNNNKMQFIKTVLINILLTTFYIQLKL
jgi:hypothetical protein